MTTYPNAPKLIKGGIVLLDPETAQVQDVISLQYNPETMTRSFQIQGADGGEGGDRSQALRLKGPPVESYKLDAELDATDLLEQADSEATKVGLHRELAILESLIYPSSESILSNEKLAASGTLEILPMETPLTLFVWSENRVLPVRVTEFSITEEAYDPALNPIRAKVSLGLRVLSIDDLGFGHTGSQLFMTYLQNKEQLKKRYTKFGLQSLGIGELL